MGAFRNFWNLGYRRLIPVLPPNADVSAKSFHAKLVGTDRDNRGKAPGKRGTDGKWYGLPNWLHVVATEADIAAWDASGANVGLLMGDDLRFIDVDALDIEQASLIQAEITQRIGVLPTRVGNWPKAGYLVRVSGPLPYCRVDYGDKGERVEILGAGRQAVVAGIHPKTKAPYTWPIKLVPFDQLLIVSPQTLIDLLDALKSMLPRAVFVTEGVGTEVSQASLRGNLDMVRKAVRATPNTTELFRSRNDYVQYGYAIKASLPDDERAAFEIFSEWSERWIEDGVPAVPGNNPDTAAKEWAGMKGPYRRGANWLYELAEQHAPEQFKKVDVFFDTIPEPAESLFGHATPELEPPTVIKWVDPNEWEGVTPPVRRWIVGGMIPDGEVTLLTGAGGVGKTLLAQQAATCVSQGLPFLGRPTMQSKVMLFLCEDSEDELQLRQRDINLTMGLDLAELSPVLRIASRKFMDNLLAIWTSNTGVMKRTKVWEALRNDAIAFGAKLTVVDTIADTFGGNEIDRSHVRQFVQACLGKLAQETGGAVLALGHPSKAGGAVGGDGTSGSTGWRNTVRSHLYLTHAAKDMTGPFRRLESKKANYGAGGDVFMLRWLRGAFELVSSKTTAPDGDAMGEAASEATAASSGIAPGVPAVTVRAPSMGNVIDDAILASVAELAADGVALSKAHNSPNWAPRVMIKRSDVLGIYPINDVAAGWERVLKAGRVAVAIVGRKQGRQPIIGFNVVYAVADAPPLQPESIFE